MVDMPSPSSAARSETQAGPCANRANMRSRGGSPRAANNSAPRSRAAASTLGFLHSRRSACEAPQRGSEIDFVNETINESYTNRILIATLSATPFSHLSREVSRSSMQTDRSREKPWKSPRRQAPLRIWDSPARTSLHVSPRGEAKCVRGPSGRGARRLARAGVLEQYVEHGKQAQRSPGGRMACFGRRVVRNAG